MCVCVSVHCTHLFFSSSFCFVFIVFVFFVGLPFSVVFVCVSVCRFLFCFANMCGFVVVVFFLLYPFAFFGRV